MVATAVLGLAACGGSSSNGSSTTPKSTTGATTSSKGANVKVGLVYDLGGRGDKSFNDSAYAGLQKAQSELGVQVKDLSPNSGGTNRDELLKLLASSGYNPVIAVGFNFEEAIKKVAPQYPNTNFAIIDDEVATGPNVANLVFSEEQGSFLVGAAAALKSKTGHVGYIGGVQVPLLEKFQAGFDAGAKQIKPGIKIDDKYLTQPPDFSGFNAPDKGKEAAKGMYDSGADVVFAAAGGSGTGVFQAAKAANTLAIGVDSDQYLTAPADLQGVILTSMIKHVDVAVFNFINDFVNGKKDTGTTRFDLKSGGVDYATSGGKVDDIKSQLDALKQQIIDGKITVPTKP